LQKDGWSVCSILSIRNRIKSATAGLIRSVHEALPAGGALVAIEALIDNARRENI
jgi:hypothetical protein